MKMYKEFAKETWEKLDKKLSHTAIKSYDKIPYTSINGVHDDRTDDICWWTNGFWSALMTLMYAATKKEQYIKTARHSMDKMDKALMDYDGLHHDVGFMWNISSGMDYRITGDKKERNRFLLAANHLMGRFNKDAGFIRAWNDWAEGQCVKGWAIIDCMMNTPLLYRAAQEIKDDRFSMVANAHADKTMKYHVRADGSCNHINEYDPKTGEFVKTHTGQGMYEGSSWSRGQAWGLYGFALSYRYTKNKEYLDTAKRMAHYFIACASKTNWLTQCDFRQPLDEELYDTTAGACAACGLLEIADSVPESEKALYFDGAVNILKALEKECDWTDKEDAILLKGTERYADKKGHHIPIIYGDYFFAEGIYRLMGYDTSILW